MSTQRREQNDKIGKNSKIGKRRYKDEVPKEVITQLKPELQRQYQFWDKANKRLIRLHTRLLIPLLNECFRKDYPLDTSTKLLSTEYTLDNLIEANRMINSIYADLLMELDGRELYHVEWQMTENKEMVLRMMQYDVQIGMYYGIALTDASTGTDMEMCLPHSVVIYLDKAPNTPNELNCRIHFADGNMMNYKVPVVKVQEYSLEEVEKKHLNILIPFLPLKFRQITKLKSKERKEQAVQQLTDLFRRCIMILEREEINGTLTGMERLDLEDTLKNSCKQVLRRELPCMRIFLEPSPDDGFRLKSELYQEMVEETARMQAEQARMQEEQARMQETKAEGIAKLIKKLQAMGNTEQEIKESLQDIFFLSKEQAEEKLMQHYQE
ncbi:MAG: hypothetical protein II994_02600 [Lachnospiraceae bacterium]|nr:hypothetical protein [Lachnospiraceae bacterium]